MTQSIFRSLLFTMCITSVVAATAQQKPNLDVDGERIINADEEPGNWLSHGRSYDEQRFSPLTQINDKNVGELGLAWAVSTEVGRGHEASPIVVDGVMYITLPWSKVLALNAKTGEELWRYDPQVNPTKARDACCDVVNRGAAIWKGMVYVGALDGRLIALDAETGKELWSTQTTDPDGEYTITGAPRVVKDKVIIGNGGAEYGVRGYFSAYDAFTGEQLWRFYTVPGNPADGFEHPEMEVAAKTWTGEWWSQGGGGTAWDSMAYDPELNLLYVGTGNGSPWNRALRSPDGGDNLYLSTILAVNPDTGRLKWHYQTTPADNWDYTATQHIILADLEIDGRTKKVLMQAPKNGFFYVLDRENGNLISAKNYIKTTWASHVDLESGRPVETIGDYALEPKVVYPSPIGGHNWQPMSYNPQTNLVYFPTMSEAFLFVPHESFKYVEGYWNLGIDFATMIAIAKTMPPPVVGGFLTAWNPDTQEEVWSVKHAGQSNGGVLSTAGNLVFQGTGNGHIMAFRADTGEKLWDQTTNIGTVAPPVTYTVDGEQYIAVLAGWGGGPAIFGADSMTAATATHINQPHMLAFKIGGKASMPKIDERRFILVPEPPADDATPEILTRGEWLFHQSCNLCHGAMAVTSGVIADLRYSSKAVHDNYDKIVLDGVLSNLGMASFADTLNKEDVAAIHSYIISRAKEDRALMLEAAKQQQEN
ncbi:MAG: PQQ-dependent dehydrogenase, methanol/ethanol family [Candidatus Hydrogenedentota bacterium]